LSSRDEKQNILNEINLYIELKGDKARKLRESVSCKLGQLGFYCSPRAEGYAFFINELAILRGLPNIRLSVSGNALSTRVHMASGLTESNASSMNLSVGEVYRRIMEAVNEVARIYAEFEKWADHMMIEKP